MSKTDRAAQQ